MAEALSQHKQKTTSISNTTKPPKKMTYPISISISTSSFFFFLISFSFLSFSLLYLSFKDPTFWFFLSNSIIFFIVAADSNSSSPSKPDIYTEYLKYNTPRNTFSYTFCITESPDSTSCLSEDFKEKEKMNEEKYRRSKLEKAFRYQKKTLRRSKTGDGSQQRSDGRDLSALSDEELNRRVEEFIKRVNREIRLQQMRERNENHAI